MSCPIACTLRLSDSSTSMNFEALSSRANTPLKLVPRVYVELLPRELDDIEVVTGLCKFTVRLHTLSQ
jgi:hypothetical protein